jgi:hypothetical protein
MKPKAKEAIEKKLILARKKAALDIISNIAAAPGHFSHVNNVDLKLELIQNVIDLTRTNSSKGGG